MCWCGSTEVYQDNMDHEAFQTVERFENALKENLAFIPPSMIYAYAAIKMGVPLLPMVLQTRLLIPQRW